MPCGPTRRPSQRWRPSRTTSRSILTVWTQSKSDQAAGGPTKSQGRRPTERAPTSISHTQPEWRRSLKLYHSSGSPNSRRVRVLIVEKGLDIELAPSNATAGLRDRAISGPHGYEQIPALIERSKLRVANFYTDFEARLKDVEFVAGDRFSAADITTLVTVDFATQAFAMPIPDDSVALKRWYDAVSARPSATA